LAVYTNINRNGKKHKNRPARSFPARNTGLVLFSIATIAAIALFTNFFNFLRFFLMGTFGVFSYALVSSLFIVAKALINGKTYNFNKKYAVYLLIALVSFLSLLQMAFLGSGNASNFFKYLGDVYAMQTSVGGVAIALITYPLIKLLNQVGAYVFYIILLTIMSALIIDYINANKVFKKLGSRTMVNFKTIEKKSLTNQKITNDNNEFYKNKKAVNLSLNTSDKKQAAYKPAFSNFNDERNNYFIKQDDEKETTLESAFTKNSFKPLFDEKEAHTSKRPPKIMHTDYSEGFNGKKQKDAPTNDEARQKNLKFLHSTMIDKNASVGIKGVNVKNPNEEFSTTNLNKKINDRLSNMPKEREVIDVDAKFEEDLKRIEQKEITSNPTIFNKTNIQEDDIFERETKIPIKPRNIISNFEQTEIKEAKPSKEETAFRYKKPSRYNRPPVELLSTISTNVEDCSDDYLEKSVQLEQVLNDFRVPAKVIAVTRGPAVTRYELQMPAGVSVKKITQHAEDIAMTLASNGAVRIEAPIPGKNAVGVEVPNKKIATIALKDIIESREFIKSKSNLTFGLGKDISGTSTVCDLAKMPHLLVAGATGSGKSVCLNSLIISLLYKSSPEDLRLILIDPKRVEFYVYNGLPHLMLPNVITEGDKAINAFNWAIEEMERRFEVFQANNVKNLGEYNNLPDIINGEKAKMPMIVIIVDELADLMLTNKREVEDKIMRLAAKARAAGIHLVLATQRPSVDVITGTIKANLSSRIAFAVSSFADSKTILDGGGADKLLGKGDMLYAPIDYPEPRRIQGAFVSNEEVNAIVDYIKQNNKAYFDDEVSQVINQKLNSANGFSNSNNGADIDELLPAALKLIIETGQASISMLQRKFSIGYSRAARIVDQMEDLKYVSPSDGSRARNVYITMEKYHQIFGED
jgi:DNA segregation ATPase FtsK/SpoIIIE, S-DNA-T family